ncbi:hypothetical protein ABZ567_02835 [Streptomyces sp. NPDC016459]|uniref:hypothetical protein n=1 Tax=Streptomyces sp. NPDC016459 TaxID=3157190 RepID=UPI0033DF8E7C
MTRDGTAGAAFGAAAAFLGGGSGRRSLATGRWQRTLPTGCGTLALDADATRTLVVEQCGKRARLLVLDTRTGTQR